MNNGERSSNSVAGAGGRSTTSIQINALDGIVNVNSLFTLAVFVGLAWNPTDPSPLPSPACSPGPRAAEDVVSFHVFAFSSFLFSSLFALCLKTALRLGLGIDRSHSIAVVNRAILRAGILASAVGSVLGCGFLMMALVNVVQLKLGKLSCGSAATVGAVVPLVTLIPAAMLIYTGIVLYAFTR